jgi:hypothetical protein
MAITKPLIFTNVGIADSNGANPIFYPLHVSESATVTVTPTFDIIDNNQSLAAFFDVSVEVVTFNTNLYNDTRVYTNATAEPTYATLLLSGAPGAQSLNITSSIISATRVYDGNRTGIQLTATKRAVSADELVTIS